MFDSIRENDNTSCLHPLHINLCTSNSLNMNQTVHQTASSISNIFFFPKSFSVSDFLFICSKFIKTCLEKEKKKNFKT